MSEQNMLLLFIACLELNLALFNLLLVSHRRRTILMRDKAFSMTSYWRFGSNTRLARARRFWIRPERTRTWWNNFVSETVVPEEWKENFRMPSQRIRGVLVWTRINCCVFGKTNPYTFESALVWTGPRIERQRREYSRRVPGHAPPGNFEI